MTSTPVFVPTFDDLPRPIQLRNGESITVVATVPGRALIEFVSIPVLLYELPVRTPVAIDGDADHDVYAGRLYVTDRTDPLEIKQIIFCSDEKMIGPDDEERVGTRQGNPFQIPGVSFAEINLSYAACVVK